MSSRNSRPAEGSSCSQRAVSTRRMCAVRHQGHVPVGSAAGGPGPARGPRARRRARWSRPDGRRLPGSPRRATGTTRAARPGSPSWSGPRSRRNPIPTGPGRASRWTAPASSAVRTARCAGLVNAAVMFSFASAGASAAAEASPFGRQRDVRAAGVPALAAPFRLTVPEQDQVSHSHHLRDALPVRGARGGNVQPILPRKPR